MLLGGRAVLGMHEPWVQCRAPQQERRETSGCVFHHCTLCSQETEQFALLPSFPVPSFSPQIISCPQPLPTTTCFPSCGLALLRMSPRRNVFCTWHLWFSTVHLRVTQDAYIRHISLLSTNSVSAHPQWQVSFSLCSYEECCYKGLCRTFCVKIVFYLCCTVSGFTSIYGEYKCSLL